jgi:hypothetical protein
MDYVIYTFGHSGHIIARQDVVFENDEDAVAAAHRLLPVPLGGKLEVWEHARLVATIQP